VRPFSSPVSPRHDCWACQRAHANRRHAFDQLEVNDLALCACTGLGAHFRGEIDDGLRGPREFDTQRTAPALQSLKMSKQICIPKVSSVTVIICVSCYAHLLALNRRTLCSEVRQGRTARSKLHDRSARVDAELLDSIASDSGGDGVCTGLCVCAWAALTAAVDACAGAEARWPSRRHRSTRMQRLTHSTHSLGACAPDSPDLCVRGTHGLETH
jgi:hypothetical protein